MKNGFGYSAATRGMVLLYGKKQRQRGYS